MLLIVNKTKKFNGGIKMFNKKSILLTIVILVVLSCFMFLLSYAAEYPIKPITVIVPYGPGGGTDLTARVLAKEAEKYIDQAFVVINRDGASGTIGATEAALAKPDGYTIFFAPTDPLCTKPHQMEKLQYTLDDFRGVMGACYEPSSLAVSVDSPWKTLEDLVAEKDTGRVINRAHSGIGGVHHTLLTIFFDEVGLKYRDIPFEGGSDALTALRGGHIDVLGGTPGAMISSIEAGEVRLLALSAPERLDLFPDTPTFKEKGYNIVATVEFFMLAPKETPDEIVDFLEELFIKAANSDKFKEFTTNLRQQLYIRTGEEIMQKLQKDYQMFGKIIKK